MNFAQKMKRYRELKRSLDETRDYLRNHKRIFNLQFRCGKPTPLGVGWIALNT